MHWSHVLVAGHRALQAGQEVELEQAAREQDGYPYRAVRVRPVGQLPVDTTAGPPGAAYAGTLPPARDDDERR